MTRTALLAAALVASACGPAPEPSLQLEPAISAAIVADLRELQVSMLPASLPSGRVQCEQVSKTCASGRDATDFLKLRDGDGREVLAVRFPAAFQSGSQEVRVGGIPVGRDYALIVEGLGDTQLLASSCTYVTQIREGTRNDPLPVTLVNLTPPPACNPRF